MAEATQQPELYAYNRHSDNLTGMKDRVFAPVCLLDHRYYLERYPTYYFIVRNDLYCKDADCERVCLYREGEINVHLTGNEDPFTAWISNDLRFGRRIEVLYRDMEEKAGELERRKK